MINPLVVTWSVWRRNLQPYYRRNTAEEACMFEALREGLTFADLCQKLCHYMPEEQVAEYAAKYLMICLQEGQLSEVSIVQET